MAGDESLCDCSSVGGRQMVSDSSAVGRHRAIAESMLKRLCVELTGLDWLACLVHNAGGCSNGSAKSFDMHAASGSMLPSRISYFGEH